MHNSILQNFIRSTVGSVALALAFAGHASAGPTSPQISPAIIESALGHDSIAAEDFGGIPLTDADLNETGGIPLIIIVAVRGGTKLVITTCSKSSSCRSKARRIAAELGGSLIKAAYTSAALNSFCRSSLGKRYGSRVCN